ncbi:MAG: c-type cytochrome [Hyphomicrobiaceae bacterium]
MIQTRPGARGWIDIGTRFALHALVLCAVLAWHGSELVLAQALRSAGPPKPPAVSSQDGADRRAEWAAEAASLSGHGGPVRALAMSQDATQLVSGSFDYSAIVWRRSERGVFRLSARIDAVDGAINAVAFDRSNIVIAGDDGVARIIEASTGRELKALRDHTSKIVAVDVSEGARLLATASWDGTARLWDLETGTRRAVLSGHRAPVTSVVFSRDGTLVFTASSDGEIRMFRAADGSLIRAVHKQGFGVNVLTRVSDGDLIAFGAIDGTVGVMSIASEDKAGANLKLLASHEKPVLALAARDGRLATAGADGLIRVWQIDGLAPLEEFENPYGPIWALAFDEGAAQLFYAGLDDTIHQWQVTPRKPFEPVESNFPRRFQVDGDSKDPVERGRVQFARKCSVCHTLSPDGRNRAGPSLYGVFGRRVGTLEGYRYSDALRTLDIIWTEVTVSKLFEVGPDVLTPGSKMPLQVMSDAAQRADLIAYMRVSGGTGAASGAR